MDMQESIEQVLERFAVWPHAGMVAKAIIAALREQEPARWEYMINGAHIGWSDVLPLDDDADEGTLVGFYALPIPPVEQAAAPTIEQLTAMCYELGMLPCGDVVPVQWLDILKRQYMAALKVAALSEQRSGEKS